MGFSENGCLRALRATGNNSADLALNWIFEHMEDADFNDPLPLVDPSGGNVGGRHASTSGTDVVDPEAIDMLVNSIGCTPGQARRALAATGQDIERFLYISELFPPS